MILAAMHGPPDDSDHDPRDPDQHAPGRSPDGGDPGGLDHVPGGDPDLPEGIRYDADLAVHEPMQIPAAPTPPSSGRAPLLIFPLGILALCLVVYVLFGLIADEGKSASDYLDTIRLGRADAWQAAHELSSLLATEDEARRDPSTLPRILALLKGTTGGDPRVRRDLILSLGHLGEAQGVDALIAALAEPDLQSRLYAIWGLGAIGDRRAVPALLPLLEDEDGDVRKMTTYALGALPGPEVAPALRAMLNDPIPDVAWNAALSLARLGDPAGLPLIDRLIDRSYLDGMRNPDSTGQPVAMTEARKEEVMISALRALARFGAVDRRSTIETIATSDPSLPVREAALETLQTLKDTPH